MTLTLHDLPDDLYDQLRRRAERHGRSLDDEIVACLQQMLQTNREDRLNRIRSFRTSLTMRPLTEDEVDASIHEGRP